MSTSRANNASPSEIVVLDNVWVNIGAYQILHGVSFSAPRGTTTMLMGRNGAGKTTTLRAAVGHLKMKSGKILYEGLNIAGMDAADIAAAGVAYVPENMGIFASLTVAENMLLAAKAASTLKKIDGGRLGWIFSLFPALEKFWTKPAGQLSGGQKQMLAIARAILTQKRLLIVDEPSKGLAPAIVDRLIEAFKTVQDEGTSILLVEQNIEFAERLGTQVAVMDGGRVVHQGSMKDFARDEDLQHRLLGLAI